MKILALELSSSQGSIAWSEAGQEPFSTHFRNDRKHSGLFFQELQVCLKRFGNPDRIVVGLGPGSYAGTRIAIATATGLAASSGAELVGVSSLCAMETDSSQYVVIGDARRSSFFFAQIRDRSCSDGPILCSEEELCGRLENSPRPVFATESLPSFPLAQVSYPAAFILAEIGREIRDGSAAAALEPIYLREPNITQPRNQSAAVIG